MNNYEACHNELLCVGVKHSDYSRAATVWYIRNQVLSSTKESKSDAFLWEECKETQLKSAKYGDHLLWLSNFDLPESQWKSFSTRMAVEILSSPQLQIIKHILLNGCVSEGLGTTEFMNLIGRNRYWPRSTFSYLNRHLDRLHCSVNKYKN